MGNIYAIGEEKNLMIYSCRQYIYLRIAVADGINRPVALAGDYQSCLSEAVYENTLYYAYLSRRGELLVRSILDAGILYRLSEAEQVDFSRPRLVCFGGELLLLYIVNNPFNEASAVKGAFPLRPEKHFAPNISIQGFLRMETAYVSEGLLLVLEGEKESRLWLLHAEGGAEEYKGGREIERMIENEREIERQKWEEKLEKVHREKTEMEKRLMEKEALLESVKAQYNELMNTARRYREEAAKWYGRAKKKPV